jgi:hypothetical protein
MATSINSNNFTVFFSDEHVKKMFNSSSLTMDDIVKEMEKLQPK